MTPEAVILRYLELLSADTLDAEAVVDLITADADLLHHWLRVLNLPADRALLKRALETLKPDELRAIADVQVWTGAPSAGSARLSLDLWFSVYRSAALAEVLFTALATQAGEAEIANARLRALLALSGVQLSLDQRLSELAEFRGASPELLEDAALELRIFAVLDGIEVGRDQAIAAALLKIEAPEYADFLQQAEASVAGLARRFELDKDEDDWSHQIWLLQQIRIAGAALKGCETPLEIISMHAQVSRSLFSRLPVLMLLEEDRLVASGIEDIAISASSSTSAIAEARRYASTRPIVDGPTLAVVDRQVLRLMGAQEAVVIGRESLVLIVDSEEDFDAEAAGTLYANELVKHLVRTSQAAESSILNDDLDAFRDSERARLRELVHEANNPLSIVHNYLHILDLKIVDPETREQIQLIDDELRRAGTIFARAREVPDEFFLPEVAEDEGPLELIGWMRGLVELHQGLAQNRQVALVMRNDASECLVTADRDRLTQIVVNLVKNAIEASDAGTRVSLCASTTVVRGGRAGVEVLVSDEGPGLSADVLEHLTEEKQSDKGGDHQGVGLKVVFELVAELGLQIDVKTSASGTEFSVFIPTRG